MTCFNKFLLIIGLNADFKRNSLEEVYPFYLKFGTALFDFDLSSVTKFSPYPEEIDFF